MRLSNSAPVVFTASINSIRSNKRLRYLVNERKAIARMLRQPDGDSWMSSAQKNNVSFSTLLKHPHVSRRFRRLEILHLVGHTDGEKIRLESESFQSELSLQEVSAWLDRMPALRLVFLSGCAFPALIDLLMKKDVPAVIATQTFDRSARATILARKYYEQILLGKDYWDAFMAIRRSFPELNAIEVAYDLESDQILWPGRNAASGPRVPWGMYFFQDRVSLLKPKRASYPLIPISRSVYQQNYNRMEKNRRMLQLATAVIVAGLLTVGLVIGLQPLDDVNIHLASW